MEAAMARSAEDDAKAIMRMMVTKGAKPGASYENSMLVQNAVWLGIVGPDLDSALSFAGQQGWIEAGANDTTVLTPAGYAVGQAD
jgi:hypothetical protein